MMKTAIAYLIVLAAGAAPALAQTGAADPWKDVVPVHPRDAAPTPRPHYDIAGLCHHWAGPEDDASHVRALNACQQDQQRAYDALPEAWNSIPQAARERCDAEAHSGDGAGFGSYYILNFCTRAALKAADDAPAHAAEAAKAAAFKFKY